jgi:sodium/hydrogen antiporter
VNPAVYLVLAVLGIEVDADAVLALDAGQLAAVGDCCGERHREQRLPVAAGRATSSTNGCTRVRVRLPPRIGGHTDALYLDAVDWGLATVGLTLLLLAAVSRRLVSTPITPAMVVVAVGVLAGPLVLDDLTLGPTSSTVRRLAEATLAVVLFSDSSRINLRALRREASIPMRLLGIGLPLTIVLGTLVALVLFGSFSLSEALILGVILAPTDAGLGSAVVTDARLPQRVRQSLNVESGLNDGICVPLLLIVLATASGAGGGPHPAQVIGEEIGYGLVGGIVAGTLAAEIVIAAGARRLIDDAWRQIIPVAAAVFAYGIAEALGGSGFIAAFTAGTLFGLIARENSSRTMRFTEETGALLDSITFLIFGAVLLGPALEHVSWQIALYAIMSLTIVRMLPVAISLWGTHARGPTVAFVGWFGPRGLASIVFAVIVEDTHQAHAGAILTACYLTVGLSVLVHGLSAAPLVSRYADWYRAVAGERLPAMEREPAHEHRPRGQAAAS